jgi:cysteine desulfurase/selenocysteine lyase
MIEEVSIDQTTYAKLPNKYEAGTPPISEVIGLGEAFRFIQSVGLKTIESHTQKLRQYLLSRLGETFGTQVNIYSNELGHFSGIVSFNITGCHPHDVAQILGEQEICIRVGHHCAQPLHTLLDLPATCRVSLSLYNDEADIDKLISGLTNVIEVLHPYHV